MIRQYSWCAALAASLILSACDSSSELQKEAGAGFELQKTAGMTPTGSEFNRALFSEYLAMSRDEYNQGDYRDSDAYALRARAAGQNSFVEPQQISGRELPADKVQELTSSRARLVSALANGSRERQPRDAAMAQTKFDCWMEQQEENRQPRDIAACRSDFLAALSRIEIMPAAAPPPPGAVRATIYFDSNKATLNATAQREIASIAARARSLPARSIRVEGYADRAGADKHNLALSQQREAAVQDALKRAGVNVAISGAAYGEDRPAVATTDGSREARNRRVEVTLSP